jgi:hypothetical protein
METQWDYLEIWTCKSYKQFVYKHQLVRVRFCLQALAVARALFNTFSYVLSKSPLSEMISDLISLLSFLQLLLSSMASVFLNIFSNRTFCEAKVASKEVIEAESRAIVSINGSSLEDFE